MKLKIPYGINNYEEIISKDYYYADKTKFIERLEEFPAKYIMFMRPTKFGKTLLTSMLENYYDKNKADKFKELYSNTYIGENPTKEKNKYCILKFNFSGIDTTNKETTITDFKNRTIEAIMLFTQKYKLDFYINKEKEAEEILNEVLKAFYIQKPNEKIYVIIDGYDCYANELLKMQTEDLKNLQVKNQKIIIWYEVLKEGTETVIDRIFITGEVPINLDRLTSGFNIGIDITKDEEFNEMLGFTREELKEILNNQDISIEEQEKIVQIMQENYGGYKFSIKAENQIYNPNMCLYFLSKYIKLGKIPEKLTDTNIAKDYRINLYKEKNKPEILKKTEQGKTILSDIVEKINPEIEFTEVEIISMLYYLGYLTISGEELGIPELRIPNKTMQEI